MDDLISRQAALDMAHAYGNGYEPEGFCVEVEDIQSLPPVQPEPHWIPCSERLPEEHEEVLTYDSVFGITFDSIRNGKWRKQPVAWMPLPTPYKGGEEE